MWILFLCFYWQLGGKQTALFIFNLYCALKKIKNRFCTDFTTQGEETWKEQFKVPKHLSWQVSICLPTLIPFLFKYIFYPPQWIWNETVNMWLMCGLFNLRPVHTFCVCSLNVCTDSPKCCVRCQDLYIQPIHISIHIQSNTTNYRALYLAVVPVQVFLVLKYLDKLVWITLSALKSQWTPEVQVLPGAQCALSGL